MLTQEDFAKRRQRLVKQVGEGNVAIVPSAREVVRNGDVHYTFRQNSDFYYLTGFNEPDAVAVLIPGRSEGEYILFNRPKNKQQEIWTGIRAGQKGACEDYGANQAYAIDELNKVLPKLLNNCQQLFYSFGRDHKFDHRILAWEKEVKAKSRSGVHPPLSIVDIEQIIHEMRLFKDDKEIALMKKAAQISTDAHLRAMQCCKAGRYEYELAAELHYEFHKQGATGPAYDSIVAGGANACILHYTSNQAKLNAGELLLIDAGAEYQYYAADITRTFPINGQFTAEQKIIYDIVLQAQLAGIAEVRPGNAWHRVQQAIVKVIAAGLAEYGIIDNKLYKTVYMHNSGHWLGLDVHDAGDYKINSQWRNLEPGMVLTVEPGIYISADNEHIDKRWHNIGVRIEDDVCVTAAGCEVLSAALPKTIDEITAIIK